MKRTMGPFILAAATLLLAASTGHAQTDPYQVGYAANLQYGESYIDIINTGLNGASPLGPGFGPAMGNVCANMFVFTSDEELQACCSCLITPNQTASFGVLADLVANTVNFGNLGPGGGMPVSIPGSETLPCAGATAYGAPPTTPLGAYPANIPNTNVPCPQFMPGVGSVPAGATLTGVKLFFENDYSNGYPVGANAWTFTWTNIPTVILAGGTYTDIVSGGPSSNTFFPSGSAFYQVGAATSGLGSFVGGGTFLAATVSAMDTSGGLVPPMNGHVDANVTIEYDYVTMVNVLPSTFNGGVTIKTVGSLPSSGICAGSAAALTSGDIVGGLLAFQTTLHATPTLGVYATTETPFLAATLSASELTSLTGRCAAIMGASNSGAGICNSCIAGGQ